jgi:hypothetical protein
MRVFFLQATGKVMTEPEAQRVQATSLSQASGPAGTDNELTAQTVPAGRERLTVPPVEQDEYRPISGWAIAALVLSLFSFLCWMDSPPLLPARAYWLPGFVLSIWAWWLIRRAENTLAGASLARIGAALSLINGVGAITSQEVTYWVVRAEAHRFANEVLDYIHQRKERELFLATLSPDQRRHKEPPADRERLIRYFEAQSKMGNPVIAFENSILGRVMLKEAPNRQNWEYRGITGYQVFTDVSNPGYQFRFLYRVRSDLEPEQGGPPLVYDVELVLTCLRVRNTHSRWRAQREWFVHPAESSVRLARQD